MEDVQLDELLSPSCLDTPEQEMLPFLEWKVINHKYQFEEWLTQMVRQEENKQSH